MPDLRSSQRREEILDILYVRGHETIANLAREFGVSTRTIKTDIKHLVAEGHPIEQRSGRYGGGLYIQETAINRRRFTREERELLERLSKALTGGDAEIMARIIRKARGIN